MIEIVSISVLSVKVVNPKITTNTDKTEMETISIINKIC